MYWAFRDIHRKSILALFFLFIYFFFTHRLSANTFVHLCKILSFDLFNQLIIDEYQT